jgi:hypothetical protein
MIGPIREALEVENGVEATQMMEKATNIIRTITTLTGAVAQLKRREEVGFSKEVEGSTLQGHLITTKTTLSPVQYKISRITSIAALKESTMRPMETKIRRRK